MAARAVRGAASLASFPSGGTALVVGASGGVGAALADALDACGRFANVVRVARTGAATPFDITDEDSVAAAVQGAHDAAAPLRLAVVATGFLHDGEWRPERRLKDLHPRHVAKSFAVNALGPALVMKHVLPLLPRDGKAVFGVLSARVASLGDNKLGGWHSYRASKAALNMFVVNGAIELARSRKHAACVALHPGTVDTALSAPFSKSGLNVRPPAEAADDLLAVLDGVGPDDTGCLLDYKGLRIPW